MRDERGRYIKGHPGGPGRPKRTTEKERLDELSEALTSEDWLEVCQTAIEQAKGGNRHAREWLSKYLLPIPQPGSDADGPAIDFDERERQFREYRSDRDFVEFLRWKALRSDGEFN